MKHPDDPNSLGADASSFLDSVRAADEPTAADRQRVRGRVVAALAATSAAGLASGGGAAAASVAGAGTGSAAALGGGLAAKLWIGVALAVVGAGTVGGVVTMAGSGDSAVAPAEAAGNSRERDRGDSPSGGLAAAAPVASVEATPTLSPADPALTESALAGPALSESPRPAEPAPRPLGSLADRATRADGPAGHAVLPVTPQSAAPEPSPAPDPSPETLADEIGLIRRAHAAARAGDHQGALRALAEHATRFPSGVLRAEREAARAIALCEGGSPVEGRAAARRFGEAHPGSPLRARVARACELDASPAQP